MLSVSIALTLVLKVDVDFVCVFSLVSNVRRTCFYEMCMRIVRGWWA